MSATGAREPTADPRLAAREAIRLAAEQGDGTMLLAAVRSLIEAGARPADFSFAAARLLALSDEVARAAGLKPLRVFWARSVTIEPLLPQVVSLGAAAGLLLRSEIGGYGSFADELMNPAGALARSAPDLVLMIGDAEDLAGDLRLACAGADPEAIAAAVEATSRALGGMISAFRQHSRARLLVQGLPQPDRPVLGEVADANLARGEGWAIAAVNAALAQACRDAGDAVFFDLDRVAARCGRARFRDERLFRSNRVAVAADCFEAYARALVRGLRPLFFPARKVLVTDLDNTLWGGIVGEDGPDKVLTAAEFPGNCYQEYQRLLRELTRRGVLLAIASKNNPPDVEEAFARRERDILLRLEDFAAVQIGWDPKSEMLRRIAKQLSLGLDSFVFVDDNPVECAEIRLTLPEVLTIPIPAEEPWRIAGIVGDQLGAFDQLAITDDDRRRVAEYRAQRQRAELEGNAGSREEFLASLEIVCTALSALDAPLARTAQLLGKTNQFNLTTRRHPAGEVERIAGLPGSQAWAVRVRDRFGDAGVVGVVLCTAQGSDCVIDSFLLSCRVIGRSIETALLWLVGKHALAAGQTRLIGEYLPTKKNPPCADFYPSHGFTVVDPARTPLGASTGTVYELDLRGGSPALPSWIRFEETP
jgi:FkbH-like protein